jgi:hypothetical protein
MTMRSVPNSCPCGFPAKNGDAAARVARTSFEHHMNRPLNFNPPQSALHCFRCSAQFLYSRLGRSPALHQCPAGGVENPEPIPLRRTCTDVPTAPGGYGMLETTFLQPPILGVPNKTSQAYRALHEDTVAGLCVES